MSASTAIVSMLTSPNAVISQASRLRIGPDYSIVHLTDVMTAVHVTLVRHALSVLTRKSIAPVNNQTTPAINFWTQIIHNPRNDSLFTLPIFSTWTGTSNSTSAVMPLIFWSPVGGVARDRHTFKFPNVTKLTLIVIANPKVATTIAINSDTKIQLQASSAFGAFTFAEVTLNQPTGGWLPSSSFKLHLYVGRDVVTSHIFTNDVDTAAVPFIIDTTVTERTQAILQSFETQYPLLSTYSDLRELFRVQLAAARTRELNVMSTRQWKVDTGLYYRFTPNSAVDLLVIPSKATAGDTDVPDPSALKLAAFGSISSRITATLPTTAPLLITNSARDQFVLSAKELSAVDTVRHQLDSTVNNKWESARRVAVIYDIQTPLLLSVPTNPTPVIPTATLVVISAWRELARTLGPATARDIVTAVFSAHENTTRTVALSQLARVDVTGFAIPIFVKSLQDYSPVLHAAEQAALALHYSHKPRTDLSQTRLGKEDGNELFLFTLQIILDMLCGVKQDATLSDMAIYARVVMGMSVSDAEDAEDNTLEDEDFVQPDSQNDEDDSDEDDDEFHDATTAHARVLSLGDIEPSDIRGKPGVVSANAPFFVYPVRASREILTPDIIDKTNRNTAWQMMNGEFASKYDFVILDAGGALGWIIHIAQLLTHSRTTVDLAAKFTLFGQLVAHNQNQRDKSELLWLPAKLHNGVSHDTKRLYPEYVTEQDIIPGDQSGKVDALVYDTPLFHLEILSFT